jgi:hypothetical protein
MRNDPAEILREFLDSAFHPARAESLVSPELCVRLEGQESAPAKRARPRPVAARPEDFVIYLTYQR